MDSNEQLVLELQKLNQNLSRLSRNQGPFFQFLSGLCRSLGNVLVTVALIGISIYFIMKSDPIGQVTRMVQNAIPTPAPLINLDGLLKK